MSPLHPEDRGTLLETYMRVSQELSAESDSRLFWLAGGAIALSGAFVPQIHHALQVTYLLVAGWVVLLVGILVVLVNHQVAAWEANKMTHFILFAQTHTQKDEDAQRRRLTAMAVLNWVAIAVVFVGIALVLSFAVANI